MSDRFEDAETKREDVSCHISDKYSLKAEMKDALK